MKLPKIDKIKKPSGLKMPGGLNTPVKRFTIKNRFLQKNLISLIVIAVLAIGTGTAYGTLSSRDADMGNDPVNGVNKDRFQVLVSGNGYKLSKNQEKNYKLQKKQNQVNAAKAAQAAQNNPNTIRTSNGNRVFRTSAGNYRYKPRTTTFKTSKVPRIMTNISDQIGMIDKKVGEKFKIRVAAYAYPYGTQNIISSDNIKVAFSSGSGKIELDKETKTGCIYEIELGEGAGKKKIVAITVTATDKKLKKTAKVGPFSIIGVEGSGKDSSDETTTTTTTTAPDPVEVNKSVSVTLEPGGTVSGSAVKLKVGDTYSAIELLKMANPSGVSFSGDDITVKVSGYTLEDSQMVREKYGKEITEETESEYLEWLDDRNSDISSNGLGPGHPFDSTHWTCSPASYTIEEAGDSLSITLSLSL